MPKIEASTAPRLSELEFVDLYIGDNFSFFKGLKGSRNLSDPVSSELQPQIADWRQRCRFIYSSERDPEFSIVIDDAMFRVTMMRKINGDSVFILRKSTAEIRPLSKVGLPPVLIRELLDPKLEGLVIITGQTGAGKTSTAVSILDARLHKVGGVAVTIEDPPEANLDGVRGAGYCMQVRASRRTGGYKEHIVRTLRANPDMILLGEVREEAAAVEVVNASLNGHLIITTMHAGGVTGAIERLVSLAASSNPAEVHRKLAGGLRMVIWQNLTKTGNGQIGYSYEALSLIGEEASGVRSKIANGNIRHLNNEIDQQMRRMRYNPMGA